MVAKATFLNKTQYFWFHLLNGRISSWKPLPTLTPASIPTFRNVAFSDDHQVLGIFPQANRSVGETRRDTVAILVMGGLSSG